MSNFHYIGKNIPLVDSIEKVKGTARYGADNYFPNMLYGKILRSPHAHARILNINTSQAEKVPGVYRVVTARNSPEASFGCIIDDERFFAKDEVHYYGDEVAGVIAKDEVTALEALDKIKVDYDPLPAVFDPLEAIKPDSPPARLDRKNNVCHHIEISRGDIKIGFDKAVIIEEETYQLPHQYQAYLEPLTTIARWENGRCIFYAPIQTPLEVVSVLRKAFDLPEKGVRFIQTYIGGGFGGKTYQRIVLLTALLAKYVEDPVRIVFSREEDFQVGLPRVPMIIQLRMGVDNNGLITAKEMHIIADNGAYSANAPVVVNTAATRVDSLYRIKNLFTIADLVYTNKIATSSMRGFGNPQCHFAVESMIDTIANKIGIDPKEIRLRNATQKGDITAHGWVIDSCGLNETINVATKKSDWDNLRGQEQNKSRGIGMACGIHVSGNCAIAPEGDFAVARIQVCEDGSLRLATSEGDIGQGANTIFTQMIAEELDVPINKIFVQQLDTDLTAIGVGAVASRVTVLCGNAVQMAAIETRNLLKEIAARVWKCEHQNIKLHFGKLIDMKTESEMDFGTAAQYYSNLNEGKRLIVQKTFRPKGVMVPDKTKYGNISLAYSFATHVAEVEVDIETGAVKVLKLIGVHDVGRAINPMAIEGQVEGGMIMGMGYALGEELVFDEGRSIKTNFSDYLIPTSMDIPQIQSFIVESIDPNGPYGAKSVGELSMVPTAAAIANGIYDAVGIRITRLPITPERLFKSLQEKKGE